MAQLVLDDLEQSLVDAAKEAGGRQWEALRRRAMPELTNLAETAMEVEQRKLAGDSSERQAATLMRMHMRRAREHNVRLALPDELPEAFEARPIAIPAGSSIYELMGHDKAAQRRASSREERSDCGRPSQRCAPRRHHRPRHESK